MAFLKFKIRRLDGDREELRAYACDSHIIAGQQKQFSVHTFGLCRDKAHAQERFEEWLKTYKRDKNLKTVTPPALTLQEFVPTYFERNEQLTGNKHQSRASLKHLIRRIGKYPLNQITRQIVLDYRDTRKTE